jgi:hypothetical protein
MYSPRAPPRLWRGTKKEAVPSTSASVLDDDVTFGLKVPIVDFFDHDYITQFVPLEDVLCGKADISMESAYRQDASEETYLPGTTSGYNFRWIHIPANNMAWVEVERIYSILALFINTSDRRLY